LLRSIFFFLPFSQRRSTNRDKVGVVVVVVVVLHPAAAAA
jgi:hypothetical protein